MLQGQLIGILGLIAIAIAACWGSAFNFTAWERPAASHANFPFIDRRRYRTRYCGFPRVRFGLIAGLFRIVSAVVLLLGFGSSLQ
jgi:hypothetical protein